MYIITSTSTFHHESTQVQVHSFCGNVLKYIPSTFKMYLSTIRSRPTFQLPSNCLYTENNKVFDIKLT